MARVAIEDLAAACRESVSDDRAEQGKPTGLVRLRGAAVPAPEGSIALRLADGATVVVLAEDVADIERDEDDGSFDIGVPMERALLLVRGAVRLAYEVAGYDKQGCGCSGATTGTAAAMPFGPTSLGGCIGHCNALENFCYGSGPRISFFSRVSVGDLQAALIHGARCRDIWQGCIGRCFDATFSRG